MPGKSKKSGSSKKHAAGGKAPPILERASRKSHPPR